ncbi:glucosaminidase domain-containing protein [Vibrio ostreicida]|nr:glucosaminidase [Vibrio ostreicida]
MRKTELLALIVTGLVASWSFWVFEKEQDKESTKPSPTKDYALSFEGWRVEKAPNFATMTNVTEKKRAFFDYLRPGVAFENKRILEERRQLESIQRSLKAGSVSRAERREAARLAARYDVELDTSGITQSWLDQMLHRVEMIPEALVLVQGANESAWGTSRFALQANNYFGQWCYSVGCGLVPLLRGEGMTHEVAKFDSVQQSIHGYFMNVNRNRAYEELREIRYQRYLSGQSLTNTGAALALTEGLLKYSERGEAYVKDLQAMIRHNQSFWDKTPNKNK